MTVCSLPRLRFFFPLTCVDTRCSPLTSTRFVGARHARYDYYPAWPLPSNYTLSEGVHTCLSPSLSFDYTLWHVLACTHGGATSYFVSTLLASTEGRASCSSLCDHPSPWWPCTLDGHTTRFPTTSVLAISVMSTLPLAMATSISPQQVHAILPPTFPHHATPFSCLHRSCQPLA